MAEARVCARTELPRMNAASIATNDAERCVKPGKQLVYPLAG
jgi:hypothetical protein